MLLTQHHSQPAVGHQLKRKSVPEQLRTRLIAELGWEVALPSRTYAGKRQLESFCLSWSARDGTKDEVCSIYTMSDCLKAKRLQVTWKQTSFCWDVVPVED